MRGAAWLTRLGVGRSSTQLKARYAEPEDNSTLIMVRLPCVAAHAGRHRGGVGCWSGRCKQPYM